MEINPIAYIHTDFPTKFGVPRQSGLVKDLKGYIQFEPHYRTPEAFKGLEESSRIWVLWDFSKAHKDDWTATVRPPRLGGKTRVGVFASRSPFRPNNIGLSSVKLDSIEFTSDRGPILHVSGIDMMNGTPVYDIKPYIPAYDSYPDEAWGYTVITTAHELQVSDPEDIIGRSPLTADQREALYGVLAEDPRPTFDANADGSRVYGFYYGKYDVRFTVTGDVLTVKEIVRAK